VFERGRRRSGNREEVRGRDLFRWGGDFGVEDDYWDR